MSAFAPKATEVLRCREMTQWANNGLVHCRNSGERIFLLSAPHHTCPPVEGPSIPVMTGLGREAFSCALSFGDITRNAL
jgi:hypothetical protein